MSAPQPEIAEVLAMGPMARIANPYPLYARLRRESPVHVILEASEGVPASVLVTRYDDVRSILRDDEAFSSRVVAETMGAVLGPTIVGMDGREHLKHRALVTPALAPRALRGDFPESVAATAHELIDRFAGRGSADLSAEYTFLYPLTVFVGILGLPADDVEDFHNWGIDLTLVAHDPARGVAASQRMLDYLMPVVRARRACPGSDLVSQLAVAEIDGERLSDLEVVSFLRLLVLAGAETTYHLMGTCLFAMLKEPALYERIRGDRALVPRLLDEALRWESPISTVFRNAARECEVAGVPIAEGTRVLCHIGSANRDERQFEAPDTFDLDRQDGEHIAFGFGKHYCAGSRLALLEAEIGLNALLDRLPALRSLPGEAFDVIGFSFRGPDRLPARWEQA